MVKYFKKNDIDNFAKCIKKYIDLGMEINDIKNKKENPQYHLLEKEHIKHKIEITKIITNLYIYASKL